MPRAVVVVSARGAERLKDAHPWVYRSDIRSSDAESGDLVRVESERGRPLGSGFWSSASQIALRFLGQDNVEDERALLRDRAQAALAFRDTLAIDATAWRAVNGEADRLPGLIVDVYGTPPERVVVVQTLTQAMDRLLPVISEVLAELLSHPRAFLRETIRRYAASRACRSQCSWPGARCRMRSACARGRSNTSWTCGAVRRRVCFSINARTTRWPSRWRADAASTPSRITAGLP